MGLWNINNAERQIGLIEKTGLPSQIPSSLDPNVIIDILQNDKKVKAGKVRFILPTAIGEVIITDEVTKEILQDVLA
jgi:3-dehydroquinate synthase